MHILANGHMDPSSISIWMDMDDCWGFASFSALSVKK